MVTGADWVCAGDGAGGTSLPGCCAEGVMGVAGELAEGGPVGRCGVPSEAARGYVSGGWMALDAARLGGGGGFEESAAAAAGSGAVAGGGGGGILRAGGRGGRGTAARRRRLVVRGQARGSRCTAGQRSGGWQADSRSCATIAGPQGGRRTGGSGGHGKGTRQCNTAITHRHYATHWHTLYTHCTHCTQGQHSTAKPN